MWFRLPVRVTRLRSEVRCRGHERACCDQAVQGILREVASSMSFGIQFAGLEGVVRRNDEGVDALGGNSRRISERFPGPSPVITCMPAARPPARSLPQRQPRQDRMCGMMPIRSMYGSARMAAPTMSKAGIG